MNGFDNLRRQTMVGNTNRSLNIGNNLNNTSRDIKHDALFDKGTFNDGRDYFNMGGSIEKVNDERKKNINFVRGYEHAKRIANIRGNNKNI